MIDAVLGAAWTAAPFSVAGPGMGPPCKTSLQASPRVSRRGRYLAIIRAIDGITQWTGYLFTLLVIPLIVANVIEVFMRYVMNAPTSWALDVTTMSFGALFMLGAAYALLKGAHVRTDMLWEKFSDRKKGIIDSIAYPAVLPAIDGDPVRDFDR